MPPNEVVTIVMIEDDPGHARLIERNLRRAHVTNEIIVLGDGQEAVDYFFEENGAPKDTHPMPLLILLELNLPGLNGYQVLTHLKADAHTKSIPVIILTTTEDPLEIEKCYALGCNVYVTKPVEYEQFADAVRKFGLFLSIVQIPNGA